MSKDTSLLRHRTVESCYVTELRENETLTVDGPATFSIVETCHNGHNKRSKVQVRAEREVKILKNWKERENV